MSFGVYFRAGKKKGKKGDEKKSKQVAQRRKQAQKMGFHKTEDGAKWKTSEMGSRAGSLDQAYGKQVNGMTATQLARAAAEIFGGSQSGESPFRVKFLEPVRHYCTLFCIVPYLSEILLAQEKLSQSNMPLLQLRDVCFAWPGTQQQNSSMLLTDVTLSAHMGERIALLGANGQGKSTLIQLMRGVISPISGEVIVGHGVRVAHYSQHSAEALPPEMSPLEYMANQFPSESEANLRNVLGSYNIKGQMATHSLCGTLSGGQRARVVFAAAAVRCAQC